MITKTEYVNVFKNWADAKIRSTNGKLLKVVSSQEEASVFLKDHFYGNNLFPCDIRIEFDDCVGYVFKQE